MTRQNVAVLVVDDNRKTRELLVKYLDQLGYLAHGAGSIIEVADLVQDNPNRYDVALVDLVLPETTESKPLREGGFEATSRLLSMNPEIKIAIFTGKDNQGDVESLEKTAGEVGAYRFIPKGSGNEQQMIEELVDTVRRMNEIKAEIEETLRDRQWTRGLLNTLEVSLSIVDRDCKVWYSEDKLLRSSDGGFSKLLSRRCRMTLSGGTQHEGEYCEDCPAGKLFQEKDDNKPAIMLTRYREGLQYVQVSATPLKNSEGNVIAALIASQDVSESPIVKDLSTIGKLQISLKAIHAMGYDSARVYRVDPDGRTLKGIWEIGSDFGSPFGAFEFDVSDDRYTQRTFNERAPQLYSKGELGKEECAPLLKKENVKQWMEFPLFTTKGRLLGLLAVDNGKSGHELTDEDLRFLKVYSDEAVAILLTEHNMNTRQEVDDQLREILEKLQKED